MKVIFEEKDTIVAIAPGIAQLMHGEKLKPVAIALSNEHLFLFDDHKPDSFIGDEAKYVAKKKMPIKEIICIINEKIKKNVELKPYERLNILLSDVDSSMFVYYLKEDKKAIATFLRQARQLNIKIKKRKVDLSPIY